MIATVIPSKVCRPVVTIPRILYAPAMPRDDDKLSNVFLPLDRETRERLRDLARVEKRNPLELGAELLKQKLAETPSLTLN